jgi:hypothetical protein
MNKKIMCGIAAIVVGAVITLNLNINTKHSHLPDIALMNIEALGCGEDDGSVKCCPDAGDSCQVGATSVPDYDEC